MNDQPRFLVLGAGPIGLELAKALAEQQLPYDHVEATDHVGGNWAHGVYETAHIISSRKTTEYPDFPMPKHYPAFPGKQEMCDYFNAYADRFDLRSRIEFNTRVTQIRKVGAGWRVEFEGAIEARNYKGVFVCNGHHWDKNLPAWTKDFGGEVLHSKDYKRPEQLAGKRVLVVGGGNSGCDLASEAARVSAHSEWSLRSGYWIMPKTWYGRPVIEFINPWTPAVLQRQLVKLMARTTIGRYSDYGLPEPDHEPFERHPTICTEIFRYLDHGRLTVRPDVQSVDGNTVTFKDGSSADYDLVAGATGYRVSFPFLPKGLVPVLGTKVPQLIGGGMLPGQRHLYIVGTLQARYGLGLVVRPYVQMLARFAALQDELPVALADVLVRLGQKPPTSELVDPFDAIRQCRMARYTEPLIRAVGRRMTTPEFAEVPA